MKQALLIARQLPMTKSACMFYWMILTMYSTPVDSWHGHVEHSDGCLKKANPTGGRDHGCPEKTWSVVVGLRPALEGFVVTMHECACETGSQIPTA